MLLKVIIKTSRYSHYWFCRRSTLRLLFSLRRWRMFIYSFNSTTHLAVFIDSLITTNRFHVSIYCPFFFFLYCWRVLHSDVEICFHPTSTGFLCRSANWYVDALIQLWKNRFRLGFQDDSCWNQSRWEGMLIGFFFFKLILCLFFQFFFLPIEYWIWTRPFINNCKATPPFRHAKGRNKLTGEWFWTCYSLSPLSPAKNNYWSLITRPKVFIVFRCLFHYS